MVPDLPSAPVHTRRPPRRYGCDIYGHPILCERLREINHKRLTKEVTIPQCQACRCQVFELFERYKQLIGEANNRRHYKQIWIVDAGKFQMAHFMGKVRSYVKEVVVNVGNRSVDAGRAAILEILSVRAFQVEIHPWKTRNQGLNLAAFPVTIARSCGAFTS